MGKLLAYIPWVSRQVKRFPLVFKIISIYGVALLPWLKVSEAQYQGKFSHVTVAGVFAVIGWSGFTHVLFLIINSVYVRRID